MTEVSRFMKSGAIDIGGAKSRGRMADLHSVSPSLSHRVLVSLRTDLTEHFDVPSVKCTDAPPSFDANAPVSLALQMGAFRDPTGNYTLGVMLWPYLPQA